MKKRMIDIRVMAEIAIFAALGFVLDLVQGAYSNALFANGGSIGIAMIVVFLISYRRGLVVGLITGLIMGFLQLTVGFYVVSDQWWKNLLQVGFDYIFAYAFCALAGAFRPLYMNADTKNKKGLWLAVGALVGGIGKYFSHFMSGVLFWPQNPTDTAWPRITYSLGYNGGYMIPSIIICTIVFTIIVLSQPQLVLDNTEIKEPEKMKHPLAKLISLISCGVLGFAQFIVFLILEIKETSYSADDYEFAEAHLGRAATYMICIIIGVALICVAIYYLVGYLKNHSQSLKAFYFGGYALGIGSIMGSLTYIFTFSYKVFSKGKNPLEKGYDNIAYYGIWLVFGLIVTFTTQICNYKFKEEI